ncbi:hypothetical protein CC86DRAFT_1444 [Ophiobolus disseminans]|uniref:Uncharacterized protein n=1 Tax=Ophiobolus disseminans TaxID=1469910 RepID=A0A6A7AIF4_9PLEO|nr:hypothetical protein CC86DRAFT_1444 [Ophiobolus disseminans]
MRSGDDSAINMFTCPHATTRPTLHLIRSTLWDMCRHGRLCRPLSRSLRCFSYIYSGVLRPASSEAIYCYVRRCDEFQDWPPHRSLINREQNIPNSRNGTLQRSRPEYRGRPRRSKHATISPSAEYARPALAAVQYRCCEQSPSSRHTFE